MDSKFYHINEVHFLDQVNYYLIPKFGKEEYNKLMKATPIALQDGNLYFTIITRDKPIGTLASKVFRTHSGWSSIYNKNYVHESYDTLENNILEMYDDVLDKLSIYDNGDNIELSMIKLKPEHQKKKIGTKIMNYITNYADSRSKVLHLTPDSSMGTPKSVLNKFYMSFGFVPNKGMNKDYRFRSTLIRYPK
jgi:GNAT superfamily N-acetyltransferase